MDEYKLPAGYLKLGKEYLAALNRLGMAPEAVLWAYDDKFDDFVLVLLTDHFDNVGPTEIYRLLTLAYNASVIPQSVSPLNIRLHSSRQSIAKIIRDASASLLSLQERGGPYDVSGKQNLFLKYNELTIRWDWVIYYRAQRRNPVDRAREWKRFSEKIGRLAA